jgi:hypothetical protein
MPRYDYPGYRPAGEGWLGARPGTRAATTAGPTIRLLPERRFMPSMVARYFGAGLSTVTACRSLSNR